MNGGVLALKEAHRELLEPVGLDEAAVFRSVGRLAGGGADLADLYFESSRFRSWRLSDGHVVSGSFSQRQGVGARAVHGASVSFAHSADLRETALIETVDAVRTLARRGDVQRHSDPGPIVQGPSHELYLPTDVAASADADAWIALLDRIDRLARAADPRIARVNANVRVSDSIILVANAEGELAADVRPSASLIVSVMAEANGRRARGQGGFGSRSGLASFDDLAVGRMVASAVRIATTNLDAVAAPVGDMPVVLAPGYPGVLFHEAVGHGLEADHHRQKLSAFTGRGGERVAARGVTVIDDGGLPGRLGSLGIDDEGSAPDRTVLIEDGVLTGLMQDRVNGLLMKTRSTGNGRRQSYAHLPMPRMTNTFLANGQLDPAEILASLDKGIYAREFGGGQVDIVTGRVNFTTMEAWLVEKGRLVTPVHGATLIGVGHEALEHVSMVGNDLALDTGIATCGKQGQDIDVSVGQPTLRIDRMMVGGRG
jgi:TldD protein